MNQTQTIEYAVHLLQHGDNGAKHWQAFVEALPEVSAEGERCDVVLEELGRKLQLTLAHGTEAPELSALEAQVQAQGHKFYGIFADDPGSLDVFDDIERQRDEHTLESVAAPAPSR